MDSNQERVYNVDSTLSHHVFNDGKLFVVTIYKDVLQAAGVRIQNKKETRFNVRKNGLFAICFPILTIGI